MSEHSLYIGLMSGTSVDAIDAALVAFNNDGTARLVATHSQPLPANLRTELLALSDASARVSLTNLGALDQRTGYWFARAANVLMHQAGVRPADITAIGSHGQTVCHQPEATLAFSTQIGSPSRIAAETGTTVVADFRNADMAVDGQGAPLAPAFHAAFFGHATRSRAVLNVGGIANLSVIAPAGTAAAPDVTGFDTGPGNALMDAWIDDQLSLPFDHDGQWAAQGRVDTPLLECLRSDAFINRAPPKSTGRDHYGLAWLRSHLDQLEHTPRPVDVQTTLCRFTAETAGDAIVAYSPGNSDAILCGGGTHNPVFKAMLAERIAPRAVVTSDDFGINGDWVEAVAFSWLARRRINGDPGNAPGVTGARTPACLGGAYLPPSGEN
ncbi:anhydro-N-acetylmuramic acid kinase [Salinisphaera orenii]|uniref:anhydro-N-acetylmuramic acid kinase n=1 Tax=Salinisphaera orenii TaxID=856731 RepID=UPI000DBE2D41